MSRDAQRGCVATIVAGNGLQLTEDFLNQLSKSVDARSTNWLATHKAADIFCAESNFINLQLTLKKQIGSRPFDVIVQPAHQRRKKILLADMESTIIEQEMLDELAEFIGMREQVAAITRRTMNGELDFATALRERVALLAGLPVSVLGEVAKRITYSPGAKELITVMRKNGAQCWLVSGGFTCFIEPVSKQLGFDRCYANVLEIDGDKIAGTVADPLLDKNSKQTFLETACQELGEDMALTAAIGDGANDIPMLEACAGSGGLGLAYKAKPNVRDIIPQQINFTDLTTLLYAQGYRSSPARGEETYFFFEKVIAT